MFYKSCVLQNGQKLYKFIHVSDLVFWFHVIKDIFSLNRWDKHGISFLGSDAVRKKKQTNKLCNLAMPQVPYQLKLL